jgi:hypothetical protein
MLLGSRELIKVRRREKQEIPDPDLSERNVNLEKSDYCSKVRGYTV